MGAIPSLSTIDDTLLGLRIQSVRFTGQSRSCVQFPQWLLTCDQSCVRRLEFPRVSSVIATRRTGAVCWAFGYLPL